MLQQSIHKTTLLHEGSKIRHTNLRLLFGVEKLLINLQNTNILRGHDNGKSYGSIAAPYAPYHYLYISVHVLSKALYVPILNK